MLEKSSFKKTTGRNPGEANNNVFYRKGVAGDWKNHFSEQDKQTFKKLAGDLLIAMNYEKDNDW